MIGLELIEPVAKPRLFKFQQAINILPGGFKFPPLKSFFNVSCKVMRKVLVMTGSSGGGGGNRRHSIYCTSASYGSNQADFYPVRGDAN